MEDQNKTDKSTDRTGPIASGLAPGPGEHLIDANPNAAMATGNRADDRDISSATGADDAFRAGTGSGNPSHVAGTTGHSTERWEWPRSDNMSANQADDYGDLEGQDRNPTLLQAASARVRNSRGAFLAGTVVAGFLVQRVLQSASTRRSSAGAPRYETDTSYGADASLESDRQYGLETAYAPETSDAEGLAGGTGASSGRPAFSRIGERVRQAGGTMRERLHATRTSARARLNDMGDLTKSGYYRARDRVGTMKEEQPLLLGALGIALGAGLGAMLAMTRRENELMGDMRDKVLGKAKEVAKTQAETVKESAQRVADFARQELERKKSEQANTLR